MRVSKYSHVTSFTLRIRIFLCYRFSLCVFHASSVSIFFTYFRTFLASSTAWLSMYRFIHIIRMWQLYGLSSRDFCLCTRFFRTVISQEYSKIVCKKAQWGPQRHPHLNENAKSIFYSSCKGSIFLDAGQRSHSGLKKSSLLDFCEPRSLLTGPVITNNICIVVQIRIAVRKEIALANRIAKRIAIKIAIFLFVY